MFVALMYIEGRITPSVSTSLESCFMKTKHAFRDGNLILICKDIPIYCLITFSKILSHLLLHALKWKGDGAAIRKVIDNKDNFFRCKCRRKSSFKKLSTRSVELWISCDHHARRLRSPKRTFFYGNTLKKRIFNVFP